ncbi:PD-(D/E)XK nuclease family protein [Streptomyces sp. NPDC047072]|uniref:PD-(D/E)XK nuclease family protein n=1 Tax=Streptomyces sp. NPDC047072 TaxID=3154809 RepID=UPI0033F054C1
MKIRPGAPRPSRSVKSGRTLTAWALGPLHDVLDLIEFKSLSMRDALAEWRTASERPVHPGLAQWTEHAVSSYLAASERIPVPTGVPHAVSLEPVSRLWARQRGAQKPTDPEWYEEMVTDRRYAGHGIRELRVVRKGSVTDHPRDEAEIAMAVGVLAGGLPVLSSRWEKNHLRLGSSEEPRLVRLVEIGCADASCRLLFEGTPEQAYACYDSGVEARIDRMIAGGSYRPGKSCGRCDAVATCPEVPSRPGLLGISGSDVPRRSWSMTTGRTYCKCPARAHLEDLFLPRESAVEDSEAVVRGKAVHEWIENRHRRTPPQPCEPDDTPGSAEAWQGEGWALTGPQVRLGVQMIGDHALVCPLRDGPDDAEVHPERPVVVYDPDADVVVIAKTDLLYRVGDRWTLRETKTVKTPSKEDLLAEYPQLALAVLLADAEALPGGGSCAVELERLTGSGPVVTDLEAAAPDVIAHARGVLKKYVAPWHTDTRFPTKAGEACKDCPFTRWCPDAVRRTDT